MSNDKKYKEIDLDNLENDEELKRKAEALIEQEVSKNSSFNSSYNQPVIPTTIHGSVPTPSQKIDTEKYKSEKNNFIIEDNLLKMIREGSNSFALLDKVIEEIAEESASLKFDRTFSESLFALAGENTKVSKARAHILKTIGDLLVTKRELAKNDVINLKGKRMQAVFKYFMTVIKTSIDQTESILPEQKELFWSNLQKNLVDFEENAEKVMAKVEEE